jgi:hypothetical protein
MPTMASSPSCKGSATSHGSRCSSHARLALGRNRICVVPRCDKWTGIWERVVRWELKMGLFEGIYGVVFEGELWGHPRGSEG